MSYNVKYTTNANVTVTVEDTGRTELGQSSVTTRLNPSKVDEAQSISIIAFCRKITPFVVAIICIVIFIAVVILVFHDFF
uniref:Uncharacterized protein n=1 Tax=Magallana gigas TaxID=29159 RepID=A0A8W8I9M4_MAGGI